MIDSIELISPTCVLVSPNSLVMYGRENAGGVPVEEGETERNAKDQQQPVLVIEDRIALSRLRLSHVRASGSPFCAGLAGGS